jgi:hypothetical protein
MRKLNARGGAYDRILQLPFWKEIS